MHKMKPCKLKTGTVKSSFKGTIERFVAKDNAFSFMSSVKEIPAYRKQLLCGVLAIVKQLGIPTCFLKLTRVKIAYWMVHWGNTA